MSPILTTAEIQREAAVLAQTGETLPERNSRLREARIQAKAAARVQIASILAGQISGPAPSTTGR